MWRDRLLEAALDFRVRSILEPIDQKVTALRHFAAKTSASPVHIQPPPRLLLKGHTGPQKNLMGTYRLVGAKTPRSRSSRDPSEPPLYRHEKDPSYYLYYYKPYGFWLVGSVPGRQHGWIFVKCKFRLPTMIPVFSRWMYWNKESSKWLMDTRISVEPIDTVDSEDKRLDLLHNIEDLFHAVPKDKAPKLLAYKSSSPPLRNNQPSPSSSTRGRQKSLISSTRSHSDLSVSSHPYSIERANSMEGTAGAAAVRARISDNAGGTCRGAWPANLDEDHFLCERCTALLKRHKHMVHRFMDRYAAHPPPFPTHTYAGRVAADALEAERIQPYGARVSVRVADYVIGTIYPSIIVPCQRANTRFAAILNRLSMKFPSFESLYSFMTKGSPQVKKSRRRHPPRHTFTPSPPARPPPESPQDGSGQELAWETCEKELEITVSSVEAMGFKLDEMGNVQGIRLSSEAYKKGLRPGMRVVGVGSTRFIANSDASSKAPSSLPSFSEPLEDKDVSQKNDVHASEPSKKSEEGEGGSDPPDVGLRILREIERQLTAPGHAREAASSPSSAHQAAETKANDSHDDKKGRIMLCVRALGRGDSGGRRGLESGEERADSMGDVTVRGAATELMRLCEATSVVEKLAGFSKCKAVLTAALRSPAIFPVLAGDHGADAYMPLLSYAIMRANPNHLLSHVQFVRLLHPNSLSVKDFVDACVAIKALLDLAASLPSETPQPALASRPLSRPPPSPSAPDAGRKKTKSNSQANAELSEAEEAETRRQLGAQMVKEGYPPSSVEFGVDLLSAADLRNVPKATAKLRQTLSDLTHLRELGYQTHEAMSALNKGGSLRKAAAALMARDSES